MHSLPFFALLALLAVNNLLPSPALAGSPVDVRPLENLPIQDRGRKKPFYTFATETLQIVSGKSEWKDPVSGDAWTAVDLMAAIWIEPAGWEDQKLVMVDNLDLKKSLGLAADEKLFSFRELLAKGDLRQQLSQIQNIKERNPRAELTDAQKAVQTVGTRLEYFASLLNGTSFSVVPPPTTEIHAWVALPNSGTYYDSDKVQALERAFLALSAAYRNGSSPGFTSAFQDLALQLGKLSPSAYPDQGIIRFEHFYLQFHPFRWAWILYAIGFTALLATSSWQRTLGYRIGWTAIALGFAFQVFGLASRVVIAGRPPVTNMYETVIWVAFGAVLISLVFEAIYRGRYFILGAAPVAILTLILADTQPAVLDSSINPLTPVLRNNFWLTVHVLSITSSYAAFALALGMAHIILIKGMLKQPVPALLHAYLYRVLQIGVLLVATGTILGGIWANYSWGRFWDWDPKETWALITFLCYLIILHGRIAGWWSGFGIAVGSVLAFNSVLMAWYGVNFVLGKGLHSYGFGTGGGRFAAAFVALELAFLAFAFYIRSQTAPPARPAKSAGESRPELEA